MKDFDLNALATPVSPTQGPPPIGIVIPASIFIVVAIHP